MATQRENITELNTHGAETARGERFEFGKNWTRFLELLDDDRIDQAKESLKSMLGVESLEKKSFIDIGSGSGLFSLAARSLGARVHSFDYDPYSVACTAELKRRYFPGDDQWTVQEASALDSNYLSTLGTFDVVYSWGVLHHTGSMWQALENVSKLVAPQGTLFIALYNDTGSQSSRWKWIKKTYNKLPGILRVPYTLVVISPDELKAFASAMLRLKPGEYVKSWTQYDQRRGMNRWRDIIDWVGGYPYEVSTPDEIFDFFSAKGFILKRLNCGRVGLGCSQFVFTKGSSN
jgi:2-polyprenyl-3-methyl-5-hydroxy-6-metoxy-1,4-benzoquinol methylase